ncbi:LuxR C-terminal-related transcriptional regulator [Niabella sp. CJ426]|uniref:LuxR C-terminal-related transcriptional regulator n=1 Tax=Niabella sp. CJ426 TaxID=3393740 RepID=UPI003CFCCC77
MLGLSTFNEQAVIRNMMDNGALGYLLKNASKKEIPEAIAAVLKGKEYLSYEAVLAIKETDKQLPIITRREKEILALIAQGLTNTEMAEKLFISIPTVNTHRKSLLEKSDVKNTALQIGKSHKI